MVDLDKVKPGERVVLSALKSSKNADEVTFVIGNPATMEFSGDLCLCLVDKDGATSYGCPLNYEIVFDSIGIFCSCDSFATLMISGCICGAMQREREAKTNG